MKLRLKNQPQLHGDQNYEAMFDLGPDLIIVEADKNLGYVCLTTQDLLKQYELINLKQHFGKINIKETWYINMICKFIKKAAQFIPTQLSKVIPLTCLSWPKGSGEIGVLRLMPKILKMKVVNGSNLSELTSRGIKCSMNNPKVSRWGF